MRADIFLLGKETPWDSVGLGFGPAATETFAHLLGRANLAAISFLRVGELAGLVVSTATL